MQWDEPVLSRTAIRDLWSSPEMVLAVLVEGDQWNMLKEECGLDIRTTARPRPDDYRVSMVLHKGYRELSRQVPGLDMLTNEVLAGVRSANAGRARLRIVFLTDIDQEAPPWKRIAIEIHATEDLEHGEVQTLSRRLEDEIRSRVERVVREHASEFRTSPIEISNENIHIDVLAIDDHLDRALEEQLKMIDDPYVRDAERVFRNLTRESLAAYQHDFILLDIRAAKIIGGFKSRTEAHQYLIDNKLDVDRYYLRKVDLSPLMVF